MSDQMFPDLRPHTPCYEGVMGQLYAGKCEQVLEACPDDRFDMVFLDPPFNLGKDYGAGPGEDKLDPEEYRKVFRGWVREAVRVLAPGGALWLYHHPLWAMRAGGWLEDEGLTLRHWVAVSQTTRPYIQGRLHPTHYALLYATKGKPRVFNRVYVPFAKCRKCGVTVKDYGGHFKDFKVPGTSLSDVWTDIPPVFHPKFKPGRTANTLNPKLLARVLRVSTNPFDLVLDPFAGYGTTPLVARELGRRWVSVELHDAPRIVERLALAQELDLGTDFLEGSQPCSPPGAPLCSTQKLPSDPADALDELLRGAPE